MVRTTDMLKITEANWFQVVRDVWLDAYTRGGMTIRQPFCSALLKYDPAGIAKENRWPQTQNLLRRYVSVAHPTVLSHVCPTIMVRERCPHRVDPLFGASPCNPHVSILDHLVLNDIYGFARDLSEAVRETQVRNLMTNLLQAGINLFVELRRAGFWDSSCSAEEQILRDLLGLEDDE